MHNTIYFCDRVKIVYVVFTHSEHPWQLILKRNFGHCYIITHDQYNWLKLNPTRLFLQTDILPYAIDKPVYMLATKPNDYVLRLTMYYKDGKRSFGGIGLRNCVTITKYMLGLPIRALTPYKLYNALLSLTYKQRNLYGIQNVQLVRSPCQSVATRM